MSPHPRSIQNEAEHLPATVSDLAELTESITAAGYTSAEALGLAGWLARKAAGMSDPTTAPTRAKYRRILAQLDGTEPPRPGFDDRYRREAGYFRPRSAGRLSAAAGAASMLAAAGHPVAALVAAPIILESESCAA
jgi:hypothetical protein